MSVDKYLNFLIKETDDKSKFEKWKDKKGEQVKTPDSKKSVKPPDQKMVLSPRFKKVLVAVNNIKHSNISKRLLEIEKSDISYIDFDEDGENVTFLASNRIDRLKKEGKPETEFWTTKMRTPQKVGRFIKQVLPKFSDDSIQKFVLKYKTILKEILLGDRFDIVQGEDIVYWYNVNNYETEFGALGASCMSEPEAGEYLNCYRNNPEQCKMVILKSLEDPERIKGRALLWKLNNPKDIIFMDRIYCNEDEDELLFTNYAKRQGWAYLNTQKYAGVDVVFPGKESKPTDIDVILDNTNFDLYPYVDTLRYFYPDKKMMANYEDEDFHLILTDTDGHYEGYRSDDVNVVPEEDPDPMVYDGYNKLFIPESRATWCKFDNAYVATVDAVNLVGPDSAFPNSPHIVLSKYTNKWYPKTECEFSKVLDTWIWSKYAVKVFHDIDKKTPPDTTHRFENKTIGKVGDDYYDLDLLRILDSKAVRGKDGKQKTEYTYAFKEEKN